MRKTMIKRDLPQSSIPPLNTWVYLESLFQRTLLQKIRKLWENALIIRLLGKTIGYRMLCTRVKNIWGLQGEFNTIDLGYNFFLFKFSNQEDYTKIQSQSLEQSNQTQPSPLNHLSGASSSTATADSSTKVSVCAQLNGDVYDNVEQQLPTVIDMSCALEPITSKEDSTMVDAMVTHTLTINSNLTSLSSTCSLD
ncbi:hypothetical protein LOK49_LG06G02770 [Camellia lanceoleosa]|uniref:Uncharacterized protein n=1 Tax=Camellia lanceoleosa TaxID=1840588 RepID=A0ACC0H849_9ERIC|nr:hypothetical protein LOK49_LG06G02770 [Camellia lanceoleosa]